MMIYCQSDIIDDQKMMDVEGFFIDIFFVLNLMY